MGFLSSCREQGLFSSCGVQLLAVLAAFPEHRLQGMQASVAVDQELQSAGSVVVAHRLSCPVTCGYFPDQGSNSCLLHWKLYSLPLSHQGSAQSVFCELEAGGEVSRILLFLILSTSK